LHSVKNENQGFALVFKIYLDYFKYDANDLYIWGSKAIYLLFAGSKRNFVIEDEKTFLHVTSSH
jgi:hypothetical protein